MFPSADSNLATNPIRVLIAEDSLVIGSLLRFNLEQAGLQATLVGNGQEAVERLRAECFDLLLTDYEMPILNGEQTCDAVRNELGIMGLPIVMCSAKCLELDADRLRVVYGIDRILQKPFSMTDLISTIRALVGAKQVQPLAPQY